MAARGALSWPTSRSSRLCAWFRYCWAATPVLATLCLFRRHGPGHRGLRGVFEVVNQFCIYNLLENMQFVANPMATICVVITMLLILIVLEITMLFILVKTDKPGHFVLEINNRFVFHIIETNEFGVSLLGSFFRLHRTKRGNDKNKSIRRMKNGRTKQSSKV
jgi:hypothetical protein